MNGMRVNGDRLWQNEADIEGRMWFLNKMKQAGLNTRIDGVGNVFGETPGEYEKRILVGSHLDTVPHGGMFDGALGVMAALECAWKLLGFPMRKELP